MKTYIMTWRFSWSIMKMISVIDEKVKDGDVKISSI